MKPILKAEFRKLLTVRSTYILTAIVFIAVCFIGFYVEGWRFGPSDLKDPNQLSSAVLGGLSLMIVAAIVGILLMSHEYRYNTIMYTLTISNSRFKVLLAKFITISAYAVFLAVLIGLLSPAVTYLGIHAHGHSLVPQTINVGNLIWRGLFFGWAEGMIGLLLAVLIRSQVGAIVTFFIIPALVEPLLSQLMKTNAVYLPYIALNQVINTGNEGAMGGGHLTPSRAVLVVMAYLVVGWIVATYLFIVRDAAA